MTRLLLALAFGLFVLSIGTGPSVADDRRDRDRDRHWDWDERPWYKSRHHHRYQRERDWEWERERRGRWQHGYHQGRVGWWWVIGDVWYVNPPPVYAYAPPVAVAPVPVPVQPPIHAAPYCREFQGDAIIDGTNQRFYGTACLQPDGAWHIVP